MKIRDKIMLARSVKGREIRCLLVDDMKVCSRFMISISLSKHQANF